MPRKTYTDRFDALLAKDYIPTRDREFIESLYIYYKSKKSLTAGRRAWVERLEEKYANPPAISNEMEDVIADMEALRVRAVAMQDEWTQGFIDSLIQQVKTGRTLSSRQKEILQQKNESMTDEAVNEVANWADSWNDEKKEKFKICVEYYRLTNSYFKNIVHKVAANADYIPTPGEYRSITDNKYTKKILAGYYADAKYNLGDLVTKSSQAPYYGGGNIRNFTTFGTIIKINHKIPTSSARGNKMYLVMDMLTGEQYHMEERWLKKYKHKA